MFHNFERVSLCSQDTCAACSQARLLFECFVLNRCVYVAVRTGVLLSELLGSPYAVSCKHLHTFASPAFVCMEGAGCFEGRSLLSSSRKACPAEWKVVIAGWQLRDGTACCHGMVSSNLRFLATSASCGCVCCRRSPGWCFAWLAVAMGIKACETICKHYSSCQRCVVAAVTEVPTGQLYAWRPPTAQICCLCWCVICVSHWPPLVGVCGSAAVTVQLAVLRVPAAYAAAALSCLGLQSGQVRETAELLTEKLPDSGCGAVWCCSSVCPGLVQNHIWAQVCTAGGELCT